MSSTHPTQSLYQYDPYGPSLYAEERAAWIRENGVLQYRLNVLRKHTAFAAMIIVIVAVLAGAFAHRQGFYRGYRIGQEKMIANLALILDQRNRLNEENIELREKMLERNSDIE